MDRLGVPGQPFGASAFPRPCSRSASKLVRAGDDDDDRFWEAKTRMVDVGFRPDSGLGLGRKPQVSRALRFALTA